MTKTTARFALALALSLLALSPVAAQRRGEYMTDDELDLARDVRRIDYRAEVFLKIAARRINALEGKPETYDSRMITYGPLPKGSQIDLLDDYKRAVEELMVKFDDEFSRTGMTDDLRKALALALPEVERQLKELDGMRGKLSQADADHYVDRAVAAAKELRDGTKEALDANPAPAKDKKNRER